MIIIAQRLTKRPPIHDAKGVMIDDGTNLPIKIGDGLPDKLIVALADNIRKSVSEKDWDVKIVTKSS